MKRLVIAGMLVSLALGSGYSAEKGGKKMKAILTTELGVIEMELLVNDAPLTAKNFAAKAKAKEFDGTTFHRIVPNFVIQGGDPLSKDDNPYNDGTGGGRMDVEPRKLSNARGTVSMASSSRAKPIDNQSDMQFFINIADNTFLDGMGFIPYAKVTKGMEVVDAIVKQPRDGSDRPEKNVVIKAIKVVEAK